MQRTDETISYCDGERVHPPDNPHPRGDRDSAEVNMKTPNQTQTLQSVATPVERPSQDAAATSSSADNVVALRQPKPVAAASSVPSSEAITMPPGQLPAVTAATASAAKGGDTVDDPKAKWTGQIGPAKLFWDKLTEAELQKTEGNEHRLATLVQARYAIPRGDAYRQVKSFHEKQKA
jgi:hypothetical protein